ncbi:hypothetical protein BV25DRAFT_1990559 [Artomyces pyxidatus]|uniref:Uncharacterized protein n=1 Tax=Artomyces pyxidatus TaxID=48021 RepID=A0ACB8T614_9AGAM|nr:hypothetical protein BV25DRAFT_1990559 [Artomyces pyxidatus]
MAEMAPPPPSPGFGARRKGIKTHPKLPLSAFSPPNSGVSESFPLPPSPSTVHPDRVVDASVRGSISKWKEETSGILAERVGAIVVQASEVELEGLEAQASAVGATILSVSIPFNLENGAAPAIPSTQYPVSLSTAYTDVSDGAISGLAATLKAGHIVDIDVQAAIQDGDTAWDHLEDLLTKATVDLQGSGKIVLSNVLPPPHDLELPIVKLLNHPTYQSYQSHIAALSLIPNLYLKFLPPTWNAPTPPTPPAGQETSTNSKEKKEWKRRIKMYLGPAVEAFGFQRILFGSAPSVTSRAGSNAGDWYEIARESFAELGVDQQDVDNVFGGNAETVYGAPPS